MCLHHSEPFQVSLFIFPKGDTVTYRSYSKSTVTNLSDYPPAVPIEKLLRGLQESLDHHASTKSVSRA